MVAPAGPPQLHHKTLFLSIETDLEQNETSSDLGCTALHCIAYDEYCGMTMKAEMEVEVDVELGGGGDVDMALLVEAGNHHKNKKKVRGVRIRRWTNIQSKASKDLVKTCSI